MTASVTHSPEAEPKDGRAISLWNLHRDLTKLADELAKSAREAERDAGNDNGGDGETVAIAPQEYFRSLLAMRRTRDDYFGTALFGEPAWDIMIELMIARINGRELLMSELGVYGAMGRDFAQQIVDGLTEAKLVDQYHNAENDSDAFLALSSEAARRMAELYRARSRG